MNLYDYFVSIFTLSEVALLVSKRSKKSAVKSRSDSRSLIFLWVIITGCMVAGNLIARNHIWIALNPLTADVSGVLIIVIGFIVRWVAIFQLGNMFTVDVAISSEHVLKTDGLYKIVRHPSYLGLMVIITGLALLMNNVLSCFIVIIPIFFIMNYRMAVEEKALTREFSDQYQQYKVGVKKIIPFIY